MIRASNYPRSYVPKVVAAPSAAPGRRLSSGFKSGERMGDVSAEVSAEVSGLRSSHLAHARLVAARRAGPVQCYAQFPNRWRDFLHAFFLNAREVAGFFQISEKAADKWWAGIGGPQGAKLAYALEQVPGARAWLFGAA